MNAPPFAAGDWVWCNFPTRENPADPAATPHATYTMAVTGVPGVGPVAFVAYTTSRVTDPPWPQSVLHFDAKKAAEMGHRKPFLLNTARIAALPINSAYFPYLDRDDHGVIGSAPPAVQANIDRVATEIRTKRPELIERLGPPLQPKR